MDGNTVKIDITHYLSAAIARNPRAYAKIEEVYRLDPALYDESAAASPHAKDKAIYSCRTEYEIKARRTLGVVSSVIGKAVRAGWRSFMRSLDRSEEPSTAIKRIRGVGKYTIFRIESNLVDPSLSAVVRLAKALNVDVKELYTIE